MMTPGLRQFRSASLRVAIPTGLPDDMQDGIREIVEVHAGNQRKGEANGLMRRVCDEADADSAVLMLHVKQYDDGMGTDQLQKFYGTHGFVVVQSEPVMLMARQPFAGNMSRYDC